MIVDSDDSQKTDGGKHSQNQRRSKVMYGYLPDNALAEFIRLSADYVGKESKGSVADFQLVRSEIRASLRTSAEGILAEALHPLWNILETAVHLGLAQEEQWRLLAVIRSSMEEKDVCVPFSDSERWRAALEHAAGSLTAAKSYYRFSQDSRQAIVARSLTFLKSRGYKVTLDGRGARLSEKSYQDICAKIDRRIAFFGGVKFVNLLLRTMKSDQCIIDGSLVPARTPAMPGGQSSAGLPYHYLYNLGLKHLRSPGRGIFQQKDATKAVELAKHLAASLNVEPHGVFENTWISSIGIEPLLRETVLYDELFGFQQWQPKVARQILAAWIDALIARGCGFPLATGQQWSLFSLRLLGLSLTERLVSVSSRHLVVDGLPSDVAFQLLAACSLPAEKIHRRYKTPTDTGERAHSLIPLIRIDRDEYIIQPTGITARALCERLSNLMREPHEAAGGKGGSLENDFAYALEQLTIGFLRSIGANVTIENGRYRGSSKSEVLEIDAAVETDDRIFLFECKKKALTAEARGGKTLKAMEDFANSFLYQQAQLARHEAALRKNGAIRFLDGKILELKGRPVEKFAINLFDHGALQDRALLFALFERLTGRNIIARDPGAQATMSRMNGYLDITNRNLRTIVDACPDQSSDDVLHEFALSTWWLSIDHLHYLCGSGDGLWEGLRKLRHLTSRSGDIVWEAHRAKNLNPVAQALLDLASEMGSRAII